MSFSIEELAKKLDLEYEGEGATVIECVSSLSNAKKGSISFFSDPRQKKALKKTNASAVIITRESGADYDGNKIFSDQPHLTFSAVADLFQYNYFLNSGIDENSSVSPDAFVETDVFIGAYSVVEAGARIGKGVRIMGSSYLGHNSVVGENSIIYPNVYIGADCQIGSDCIIYPGVVIGGDGFGYAREGEEWKKVPQLGRVLIGNKVEIGSNTCVDRGALDDTFIDDGVKIDNLVQVAHNVTIGKNTVIAGCTGIAGSARIGSGCAIGGQAGIFGHLSIADNVTVATNTLVTKTIKDSGVYSSSLKALPIKEWQKTVIRLGQLDSIARRLDRLEKDLNKNGS